ncbi:hypothetical protein IWY39_000029 [Sphingobium sp. JAI105]|nr:hypothetical protein [Sphingobium sp. JAI105]
MGDTFSQNNVNGDNIVNLGKQPSTMTEDVLASWFQKMKDYPHKFGVGVHGSNPESMRQAEQLYKYLIAQGIDCSFGGGAQFDGGCHAHINLTKLGINTPYILVDADK